jgi:hypothetical protein
MGADKEDQYLTHMLEAWKTSIEVQQHFNTLEMQIRNFAITVLTAVLGAAALSLGSEYRARMWLGRFEVPLASLIFFAGLVAWGAFYFMDRFWYHRLLRGAVSHAQAIEKALEKDLPGIGLSSAIAQASPVGFGRKKRWAIHSSGRLDIFYGFIAGIVLVLLVASLFVRVE